jgi:hypothetical protein
VNWDHSGEDWLLDSVEWDCEREGDDGSTVYSGFLLDTFLFEAIADDGSITIHWPGGDFAVPPDTALDAMNQAALTAATRRLSA